MKALFSRFNKGLSKDRERDKYSSSSDSPASSNREKLPELPPLQEWSPPLHAQRVTSTPSSFHSTKPLPDISARPLPPIGASPVPVAHTNSQTSSTSSRVAPGPPVLPPALPADDTSSLVLGFTTTTVTVTRPPSDSARQDTADFAFCTRTATSNRRATDASATTTTTTHTVVGDAPGPKKQVAFISPPPTPAPLQRALSEPESQGSHGDAATGAGSAAAKQSSAPLKTTVSRFQAAHGVDTRPSSSKSKTPTVGKSGANGVVSKGAGPTATSPNSQKTFTDAASINASMRSGTPYSQASQSTSRILATSSWSEAAEEDLVSNLGPRERTRQEVLWEIVASEERCVYPTDRNFPPILILLQFQDMLQSS